MKSQTEVKAYNWLKKEKGYQDNDIRTQSNKSPDFICTDGKRYEVKLLYGNMIIFYTSQTKQLKDNDIILVFNKKGNFVSEFLWKDRRKTSFYVNIIDKRDKIGIEIKKTTIKRLKKRKITNRDSYDEVINRTCDIAESKTSHITQEDDEFVEQHEVG